MRRYNYIIIILVLIFVNQYAFSQRGKDGAKIISNSQNVNEYTYLTSSASVGSSFLTVQNSALNSNGRFSNQLEKGDLLFIYAVQGSQILGQPQPTRLDIGTPNNETWGTVVDYRSCGLHEFVEVKNVTTNNQIELICGLKNNYPLGNYNEKVIIVRVPRYVSLTINAGGEITCPFWNGTIGGAIVVEVKGATIINGEINASEKGFRGGDLNSNTGGFEPIFTGNIPDFGGEKGEGIAGFKTEYNIFGGGFGKGAAANGGGGGNAHNGGGAGGANASDVGDVWTGKGIPSLTNNSWTTAWNLEQAGLANQSSSGGGRGGYCWSVNDGDAMTDPPGSNVWGGHNRANNGGLGGRGLDYSTGRIFYGGGGGSGHQNESQGGKGGNGGGLIYLSTYGSISGSGKLVTNGQNGKGSEGLPAPFSNHANKDGSGGAGAGGTIILKSSSAISGVNLEAVGGSGGNQVIVAGIFAGAIEEAQGPGGGGSGGYISVSNTGLAATLNGGVNGTTNSPSLANFPPNGATVGDTGLIEEINKNINFYASNDTICGGGSVTITPTIIGVLPTASGQLEWYNSYSSNTVLHTGNTFVTPVLTATTTYYFGGCSIPYRDSVTIVVSPKVIIDTTNIIIIHESCIGNDGEITSILASGGTGQLEYLWNNTVVNSLDTTGLVGGTFNLIVKDTLGCSDTISNLIVNPSNSPKIDTSWMVKIKDSCSKATGEINGLFVLGGSGSYLYKVNGNIEPSLNVNNLIAGSYEIIALDNNNGCGDTINISIESILPSTIFLGNDTTICVGQSLLLNATLTNASYLWQDGSVDSIFIVSTPGIYWVQTTVNGCVSVDSIEINFTNGQTINLGNDTNLCAGENLLLDATSSGGVYSWQDMSINPTFNVINGGQYSVKVDVNGCINYDTINVTFSDISVNLGNDTSFCMPIPFELEAKTPLATYIWNDASTDSVLLVNTSGQYWVTITELNCSFSDTINIIYNSNPIVNLGNDTILCLGENLLLDASNTGAIYTWQDATNNATYNVTNPGEYYVIVNINECIAEDTINIMYSNLAVDLGSDIDLCDNDSVLLDVTTTGVTYLWQNGSVLSSFNVTSPGVYWVQITENSCVTSDSINVNYNFSPSISLGEDSVICSEDEIYLDASYPNSTYLWNNGSTSPNIVINRGGEFFVDVTNLCGTLSDTIIIADTNCSCNIYIPNSFSPNGDGSNDVLIIKSLCDFIQFEFKIFNRMGILVYETDNITDFWDGSYKGGVNEAEVYVWKLKYRISNEIEIHAKTGHVTMVK